MTPQTIRDRVLLLLINGLSNEAVESFCLQQGLSLEAAREVVSEARKRITVAADYTRDEQLGKAVMRLEDLYAKAISGQDIRTALQAQRELNRLLSLYTDNRHHPDSPDEPDRNIQVRQLELIGKYLIPLKLADPSYPLEEHARLAAEWIRRHGHLGA